MIRKSMVDLQKYDLFAGLRHAVVVNICKKQQHYISSAGYAAEHYDDLRR